MSKVYTREPAGAAGYDSQPAYAPGTPAECRQGRAAEVGSAVEPDLLGRQAAAAAEAAAARAAAERSAVEAEALRGDVAALRVRLAERETLGDASASKARSPEDMLQRLLNKFAAYDQHLRKQESWTERGVLGTGAELQLQ